MGGQLRSINEPDTPVSPGVLPVSINEPPSEDIPEPVITELRPPGCAIGDADFTLEVVGTDFTEVSVINFAGHDEPTTLAAPDTLTTIVKPSLWQSAVVVQCLVRTGPAVSAPVDFTFSEPEAGRKR